MAKKASVYSKVNFVTLKNELFGIMKYLSAEKVNDKLEDDIDWKINKKGGVNPVPVSTLEKKIETQMNTIDTCSKILKVIFEKEGLFDLVKTGIETLTSKLNEIENYYSERPISEMQKRYVTKIFSTGNNITFMVSSREDRINSRTRVLEKIFKVKPLITELENMKEEVIKKGGEKSQNQCYMAKKSPLKTDIFNYHTPEFFINMKSVPDKQSSERGSFILEEKRKCREGINLNGIYIPGSLYMHLNYYNLEGDSVTNPGKKEIMLPTLRDNEWIIFNDYDLCKKQNKLYPLFGARQISKSETEVSLCLGELSMYSPTEAMALFANDNHRDTFVKKARIALLHGEKFIYIPNIDRDWKKNEIRFGMTLQDGNIDLRGTLYIYNTQEGKKIQVGSGKTLSFFLIDEAATAPFKSILDTMEPALMTDLGNLRCSPIIAFTGGETQKAEDAKNLVEYPSIEKQFTMTLNDGKVIGGRFMDGRYRKDCKFASTVSKYTGITTNTWIDDYPIMVTDFDYAIEKINKEREEAAKDPNKNTLVLKKIFFPLTLEEVFLTESNNKFPVDAINSHQKYLKEHYQPLYVEFYRDHLRQVKWRYSDLRPINKFPVTPSDDKSAPVQIFEHPVEKAPLFTYCIGIDPVNKDESNDKIVSLFSIYVYKRMISPLDEFKNQIVASISYRPKELSEAHELALMLAEYYNAIEGVLPEASENSIFQYFFLKRKGQYLADVFDLQCEIAKRKIKGGKKGLPPTTPNQRHYMGILVEGANEEIISVDEEGDETMVMGITKEYDYMLLEEYKAYKGKVTGKGVHDGNYDRIIARGCAETLAKYYDVKYPITSQIPSQKIYKHTDAPKSQRTFFGVIQQQPKDRLFKDSKSPTLPRWMQK